MKSMFLPEVIFVALIFPMVPGVEQYVRHCNQPVAQ
jgi:uncharacterized membrane protein YjjB (DUF3815 family)